MFGLTSTQQMACILVATTGLYIHNNNNTLSTEKTTEIIQRVALAALALFILEQVATVYSSHQVMALAAVGTLALSTSSGALAGGAYLLSLSLKNITSFEGWPVALIVGFITLFGGIQLIDKAQEGKINGGIIDMALFSR